MNSIHENELKCGICIDWFIDPISLPCCGKFICRICLINWFNSEDNKNNNLTNCPFCRRDLEYFQVEQAPKATSIAYMVEQERKKEEGEGNSINPSSLFEEEKSSLWKAKLHVLTSPLYQTRIGKLLITNNNSTKYNFKTLLIPVIDTSGSMGGNAIQQVKYSLQQILNSTYDHSSTLLTHFITYSDKAKNVPINTARDKDSYKLLISQIQADGGTSFKSAFQEIIQVCEQYKSNKEISSLVIIFLTDGEDSSVQANKRMELTTSLKQEMNLVLNNKKPYTVHTIGFGPSHDYSFLNGLRQIGSLE